MRPIRTLLLLFTIGLLAPAHAQLAIGQWRDHFPYLKATAVVEGGGKVYCATRNGLFSYSPSEHEIQRLSKINGLSDVDLSALGWSADRNTLLVGYGNGNLDLVTNGHTVNLSDIKRSSIIGNKIIRNIVTVGPLAYLSCGFGVVVVDMDRQEVRDTWLVGPNAALESVNQLAFAGDSIYLATDAGLFSAWKDDPNLAAFTNWHLRSDLPRQGGKFNTVVYFAGKLVVNYRAAADNADTVFYNDGSWHRLTANYGRRNGLMTIHPEGDRLIIPHAQEVNEYDPDLHETFYLNLVQGQPFNIVAAWPHMGGGCWVATSDHGLALCAGSSEDTFIFPNGPHTANTQRMQARKGTVMAVAGAVAGNWTNAYSHEGVSFFQNGTWTTVSEADDPLLLGVNSYGGAAVDEMTVVMDPNDPQHAYTGSWEEGVLEWRNGHVQTIWNAANSSLGNNGNPSDGIVDVAGMDFDVDGNLWVSNANCDDLLSVRKKNGTWKSFSPGGITGGTNLISDIVAAHNNIKWMVRPRGNGILVFTDNGTIDDTGDDQFKVINTFEEQGKLPTLDVYSIAEDLDHQIWVGTGKGIAVFYNPDAIFLNDGTNWDCQQILIEQDGNVQILLETETVNAIAVDGANRKWLGTQSSGVFLVSADGTQQIQHFSAENSPLPSNTITSLAIDGSTGEVFIGTDQGIISYRSDATEGADDATCANVFPNPVRESYQGQVAITGLVANSDVRITDVAGNLVYKTTSLGGQAMWPGTDLSGNRVSTGVYLVMASDPNGDYTCNTRVLVVR